MRVYVGQARGATMIAALTGYGFGECVQPREYPPRRTPWFFDNGAFSAWRAGEEFDTTTYSRALGRILSRDDGRPDFVLAPDIVAGGLASLDFSLSWVDRLKHVAPVYLAVQDGMGREVVEPVVGGRHFDGLFVGGTLHWKVRTGASWVQLAHRWGLPCHIGRVGTPRRVKWAKRIGADSIDSCLPLWSAGNMERFVAALGEDAPQRELSFVTEEVA